MIEITENDISIEEVINKIKHESVGAIVTFLGTVRGFSNNKQVKRLEIDAYKEMAIEKMIDIKEETLKKFEVEKITIIHRIGKLNITENIVLIAVAGSHRKQAFRACEYIINELKKIVPIWKLEITKNGKCWK